MEYIVILWNLLLNLGTYILYLFPFWILDNITAFFPEAMQNIAIVLWLTIFWFCFWFIFLVYFANILLMPIDDDIKVEENDDWVKKNIKYHRTFLWQTIRFILWSKNIVSYYSIFVKFISGFWMKLIPLLIIFIFLYFPIMPGTQWFPTLGSFVQENSTALKEYIQSWISDNWSWSIANEILKNKFWKQTPEMSNLKSSDYVSKLLSSTYQNDAAIKLLIKLEMKNYQTWTWITEYESLMESYINLNMPTILKDSKMNPTDEKRQQIVLWTISEMQKELYSKKQIAKWKQPIKLFWWKIIYSWFKVDQFYIFINILNWILIIWFTFLIILISGWKNLIILYLFLMESMASKFEQLQNNEFFQKITAINKKLKEIWSDIKEWDFLVQNSQHKEMYMLLIIEVVVRLLIVYNIIYF